MGQMSYLIQSEHIYSQKNIDRYKDIYHQSKISNTCIYTLDFCLGSIIRCMRRLEEVLRQMCSASKAIGNTELENKFAEGRKHIAPIFHLNEY